MKENWKRKNNDVFLLFFYFEAFVNKAVGN
jgi:hypothetical protein